MNVSDLLGRGVEVLTGSEAARIREQYIDRFVDGQSDWYRQHIAKLRRYKDGEFYSGYLWDVVRNYSKITEDRAVELSGKMGRSYAFWDLHSAEKIPLENYWKFPKEAVLKGMAYDIVAARDLLPEDLYVVSEDFGSSVIFTHESEEDGNPILLVAHPQ